MIGFRLLGVLLLTTGLVAGCSSSSPLPTAPGGGVGGPGAVIDSDPAAAAKAVAGYQLGPNDKVRLTVFRHEDLSGEFELDGEGYFAMPLVGEILAGGLTARQLENEIEVQLKGGGYLVNPQVSLEVLNYRPFYIVGEVRNPGSYPYVNGMTVINAVALAGGFTYRASQSSITITRGGSNGNQADTEPQTQVLPGDVIEVPERFF